jgi:hypothetical protein
LKEKPDRRAEFDEQQGRDQNPDPPAMSEVKSTELRCADAEKLRINHQLDHPYESDQRPGAAKMDAKQGRHAR